MLTYQETLDFLYNQLPMYQRVGPPAIKKGLDNTRALSKFLGNPEREYQSIHLAGTNGKGSVSHMLAACYQAKGLRVGLYTSPHYRDFRERVRINGEMITRREVTSFVDRIRDQIKLVRPSFFEITVALAFDAFARHRVDIAIIETGLGGRLDSTNIVVPMLSVITNISLDHTAMLGNSLTAIAREKAGIIKKDTPVVVGRYQREPAEVFRKIAAKRNARLSFANRSMSAVVREESIRQTVLDIRSRAGITMEGLIVESGSPFVAENTITTLHTLQVAGRIEPRFQLHERLIREGLGQLRAYTGYCGRWQVLDENPLILADSAHNTQGFAQAVNRVAQLCQGQLYIVIGLVIDKDIQEMLSVIPLHARLLIVKPDVPRGLETHILAQTAKHMGFDVRAYSSVRKGLAAAKQLADRNDLVFVGGSSFVVAEVV